MSEQDEEKEGRGRNLKGEAQLVTAVFSADRLHTNTRIHLKKHMYIRPESPADVLVKHSITKTRELEDDKCVPKESVIGSGIKGLPCL